MRKIAAQPVSCGNCIDLAQNALYTTWNNVKHYQSKIASFTIFFFFKLWFKWKLNQKVATHGDLCCFISCRIIPGNICVAKQAGVCVSCISVCAQLSTKTQKFSQIYLPMKSPEVIVKGNLHLQIILLVSESKKALVKLN